MAGDTIKMKDLPVAESKTGFKVIGVDSQGKSKKLDLPDTYEKTESDAKYSTKAELATIRPLCWRVSRERPFIWSLFFYANQHIFRPKHKNILILLQFSFEKLARYSKMIYL